ncbi:DNA mismatch repair endonuclease MutL [Candidatus Dojkabacteria bacterium]|nr:DNA mismatch repair endonuclease MutL [Candidatus Dojkabacteria bacterium]
MPNIIKKLDQKLIDQIAAGEVVERPASVLKELLDNAIDAGATKITIRVHQGGIKRIEVQDNGVGMSPSDLSLSIQPHTTSKIEKISDLNKVETLGFRGEALASIASVSKVRIASLASVDYSESGQNTIQATQISIEGGEKISEEVVSRDFGTTVVIEDLFYNVPARRKFLKTPRTEYRKLLDTFIPVSLINPQIHFVFQVDDREVYNLPSVTEVGAGTIHPQRLSEVIKGLDFVGLFYDGEGITVGGVVGHPKHHGGKVSSQFIYVNGRPVWDNGIAKAVTVGASRFIPDGMRVPFVIAINLPPDGVDVNVHPRKTEVKFANPFRIYSAVEKSVKAAYEENLGKNIESDEYHRFRKDGVISNIGHLEKDEESGDDTYVVGKKYGVRQSMEFSRMLLQDHPVNADDSGFAKFDKDSEPSSDEVTAARQFMSRYIVASVGEELWIVDQHAAAERIRFETLIEEYSKKKVEVQNLLSPLSVEIGKSDIEFVKENVGFFEKLGFILKVEEGVDLAGVPSILSDADHAAVFMSVIEEIRDVEEFKDKDEILDDKFKSSVIATMACHSSVRMNQKLSDEESLNLVKNLLNCANSYSCPHGRPIVWRLEKKDIEVHFDRE